MSIESGFIHACLCLQVLRKLQDIPGFAKSDEKQRSIEPLTAEVGVFVSKWRFEDTKEGKRFLQLAHAESTAFALASLQNDLDPKLAIERSLRILSTTLSAEFHQREFIRFIANDIIWYIGCFNTFRPVFDCALKLLEASDSNESDLVSLRFGYCFIMVVSAANRNFSRRT